MTLQDYSTEELRAELKRRSDLDKAEKAKVKRCRMCKHWGGITYCGNTNNVAVFGINRCCKFFKTKSGNITRYIVPISLLVRILKKKRKYKLWVVIVAKKHILLITKSVSRIWREY